MTGKLKFNPRISSEDHYIATTAEVGGNVRKCPEVSAELKFNPRISREDNCIATTAEWRRE